MTADPAFRADVLAGLAAPIPAVPARWLYDHRGSELFEEITRLPEYYPTRTETAMLERFSGDFARLLGAGEAVVEFGSGSSAKTPILLRAVSPSAYVPVDISEEITHETAEALVGEYPGLAVRGLVCDFEHDLERIPDADGGRLVAFLGGTVGNLYPEARRDFLTRLAALMGPDDRLLLGTDLVKAHDRLEAAYDDASGVTAEFNKNVLRVLNRELGADFDLDAFEHVALYDAEEARMDIRLRSLEEQTIRVEGLEMDVSFARGEEMRTEISSKFTYERLTGVYEEAGLAISGWFTDTDCDYALSLARPL